MAKNERIDVSESEVEKWLGQLGIRESEIRYIGQKENDGPPDFEAKYGGKTVAIEVTLFNFDDGWGRAAEEGFRRRLGSMLREAGGDEVKGHGVEWYYEYSPEVPLPSNDNRMDSILKRKVEEVVAFVKENGVDDREFQIGPDYEGVEHDGIFLHASLLPTSGDFEIRAWGVNMGVIVIEEECKARNRIKETIREKSAKIRRAKERHCRAENYDNWWLVLVDDTSGMAGQFWTDEGKEELERTVQNRCDLNVWNKIVLLNRFWNDDTETNNTRLRFWPLWEDPSHSALPSIPPPMPPSIVIRPEAPR